MTDEESGEGSEQSSNKDQDSDVSFQEDQDEEIDKSEKESRLTYEKDANMLLD